MLLGNIIKINIINIGNTKDKSCGENVKHIKFFILKVVIGKHIEYRYIFKNHRVPTYL